MLFKSVVALSALASISKCFALPARAGGAKLCNATRAVVDIPAGGALPAQAFTTSFLAIGVGTQNYTCASTGTYTNVGALAELYDVSCKHSFNPSTASSAAFKQWSSAPAGASSSEAICADPSTVLGEHYFVVNPVTGTGLNPEWDFTSHAFAGNPDAFVVGAKNASLPAPTGTSDIDWLYLKKLTGSLAEEIYRTDTRGGQPPASCTPGSDDIFVKYTAVYWLTGGSV